MPAIASPDSASSPVYRVRGQRSNWRYPDQRLTAEHTEELTNVNLSLQGSARSRYGYTTYNGTVLASSQMATGLIQAKWSTGLQQLVVTPTKVYWDTGSARTDITGSLSLNAGGNDDRVRWTFFNDKVVATNGKDESWYKDGDFTDPITNAVALTGMPWSTCEDFISHRGLLLAFAPTESSTKYPTRLRWCDINTRTFVPDLTVWPDANRYEVYEGGPAIVGAVDAFGRVLIFKEDGLYVGGIAYDTGFIEFRLDENATLRGFHPIAKCSLIARPEFVHGVAREGAFIITPDLQFKRYTDDVLDQWRGLSQTRLQYAQSRICEQDHQVRTLLSSAANTSGHDLELVYDWYTGDCWFDEFKDKANYVAEITLSDVYYDWRAGTDSYLYKGNNASYTIDYDQGFDWRIRMAPNDLGYPERDKLIINLRTLYRYRTNQQRISLAVHLDQDQQAQRLTPLDLAVAYKWNGGYKWNAGLKWPAGTTYYADYHVNRTCQTLAPEWQGSDPIEIVGYTVTYQVLE